MELTRFDWGDPVVDSKNNETSFYTLKTFKAVFYKKTLKEVKNKNISLIIKKHLQKLLKTPLFENDKCRLSFSYTDPSDMEDWLNAKGRKGYSLEICFDLTLKKITKNPSAVYSCLKHIGADKPGEYHWNFLNKINLKVFQTIKNLGMELVEGTSLYFRQLYRIEDFFSDKYYPIRKETLQHLYDFKLIQELKSDIGMRHFSSQIKLSDRKSIPQVWGLFLSGVYKGKACPLYIHSNVRSVSGPGKKLRAATAFEKIIILPDPNASSLKEYYQEEYKYFKKALNDDCLLIENQCSDQDIAPLLDLDKKDRKKDRGVSNPLCSLISKANFFLYIEDERVLKSLATNKHLETYLRLAAVTALLDLSVEGVNEVWHQASPIFKEIFSWYFIKESPSIRFMKGYDF